MKKTAIFPIALLALLLAQTVGWQLLSLSKLSQIRRQGHAAAANFSKSKQQEVFNFSKKEFEQKRFDRREFWHEGRLFDFEKIENLAGDSVRVTAHHDSREQRFLEKMGCLAHADDGGLPSEKNQFPTQLARFLGEYFLPAGADSFLKNGSVVAASRADFSFLFFFKNWLFEPPALPPEF